MPTWQVNGHAEKRVTLKARHNSNDELPYEKKQFFLLPRQLREYMLDLCGVHHFSRVVFW